MDRGGRVPTMGCHSVMDRPERVRRVAPPTTTMAKTITQQASSHQGTARRASVERKGPGFTCYMAAILTTGLRVLTGARAKGVSARDWLGIVQAHGSSVSRRPAFSLSS